MSKELKLYDALKRITRYQTPRQLERSSEKQYGLDYTEALEMAYENVLAEAKAAIKGVRRPVSSTPNDGSQANG